MNSYRISLILRTYIGTCVATVILTYYYHYYAEFFAEFSKKKKYINDLRFFIALLRVFKFIKKTNFCSFLGFVSRFNFCSTNTKNVATNYSPSPS